MYHIALESFSTETVQYMCEYNTVQYTYVYVLVILGFIIFSRSRNFAYLHTRI